MSLGTLVYLLVSLATAAGLACSQGELPRVLFLTHSAGFTHGVVQRGSAGELSHAERALVEMTRGTFDVDATQDCSAIDAANLARYAAVVFYTTGELPIAAEPRAALFDWVRRGGAFVGIHCAADTWYQEPRYMELVGGAFDGHPWTQKVGVVVEDEHFPAVRHLGGRFEIDDEIYQFKDFRGDPPLRVLLSLDGASVDAAKGKYERNPIAWCRDWGEGRVFYTALGHRPEVWDDPRYREHLVAALRWAIRGPDYAGKPPPGAIPMLDAAHTDGWKHKDGKPCAWKRADSLGGGAVEIVPGTGDLVSERSFGDHLVHVEFNLPAGANSGVYLHGRYEVQVLDSHGRPDGELRQGDCGGIYGVAAPALNASRAPGRWQAFDIRFTAPRIWNAAPGTGKTDNARITVWHNGIKVQDDVELFVPTAGGLDEFEYDAGPLLLQDHGAAVQFRNVWVLPLDE
jgi:type 1 glutamine amidotransferase